MSGQIPQWHLLLKQTKLQQEAMFVHDPHHYISAPAKTVHLDTVEITSPFLTFFTFPSPQTKPGVKALKPLNSNPFIQTVVRPISSSYIKSFCY